jgi:hypothetical protein
MNYKLAIRVETKVLKSLAIGTRASKPLNLEGLYCGEAKGSTFPLVSGSRRPALDIGVGDEGEERKPKTRRRSLLRLQRSDVVDHVGNPLLHLAFMSLADAGKQRAPDRHVLAAVSGGSGLPANDGRDVR